MSTTTDYPDFSPHVAAASQIAATGVPLLTLPGTLINALLQNVAANGGTLVKFANFTQVGYALQIITSFPANATNPFCEVTLNWSDPVNAIVYDEAHYFVPGSAGASGFTVIGNGPVRSSQLTVTVTNLDPAQAATVTLQVAQDSSIRTQDRWYWRTASDIGLTVPGFSLATLTPDEDVLGLVNGVAIPASTTSSFLFGMAPGRQVQVAGVITGAPLASLQLFVIAVPASIYTGIAGLVRAVPPVAQFTYTFTAPRSPVTLTIVNNSTTAGTLQAFMNAAEL